MNVNKKLDRFKQWAGERMGGEAKTDVSDDFKSLEQEMNLRHEGMERLQKSMTGYVKTLSKRSEGDDKEKILPVAYLGSAMISHGEDFEKDSVFGQCLISLGRTNERIGYVQETYVAKATSSWLESLERSLAQMKDYQSARKKLENRRLAYDTSLAKMQKTKKEDFRVEEELRIQKAKYEETKEDVFRRMQDIQEAEIDSVTDLGAFLDAQLSYFDRCREVLLQVKRDWPAAVNEDRDRDNRRKPLSRSNTAQTYSERYNAANDEPSTSSRDCRPAIRSNRVASAHGYPEQSRHELSNPTGSGRAGINRSATFEGPTQLYRDSGMASSIKMSRVGSENVDMRAQRAQLRPSGRTAYGYDQSIQPSDDSTVNGSSSPDLSYDGRSQRSASPATSHGSIPSRKASCSNLDSSLPLSKKQAPPPPPSRGRRPPPPPPPMKKSALGTGNAIYS